MKAWEELGVEMDRTEGGHRELHKAVREREEPTQCQRNQEISYPFLFPSNLYSFIKKEKY